MKIRYIVLMKNLNTTMTCSLFVRLSIMFICQFVVNLYLSNGRYLTFICQIVGSPVALIQELDGPINALRRAIAEVKQHWSLIGDTHVLPKFAMKNNADVTGGNPIAVLLQSISGVTLIV
jgi:hypothetical protein